MSVNEIIHFLRSRGIQEDILSKVKEEKIDSDTVLAVDDQTLGLYIPTLGDRIALKQFCSKDNLKSKNKSTKRSQLFDLLKRKVSKMETKNKDGGDADINGDEDTSLKTRQQSRKETRRVEFGWIHNKRQVRKRLGGGTRKADVDRKAKKADLLKIARDIYFPNGTSTKGPAEDFNFELLDFKESLVPDDISVEECYAVFKVGIVTFYLHTSNDTDLDTAESKKSRTPTTNVSQAYPSTFQDELSTPSMNDSRQKNLSSTSPENDCQILNKNVSDAEANSDILNDAIQAAGGFQDDFTLPDLAIDDEELSFNWDKTVQEATPVQMTVHRGAMAFSEICSYFKDDSILNKIISVVRILPNGEVEQAQDTGGVLKDTLTEFWEHFYAHCTEGRDVKVPRLRHDFGLEEWKAIGRVLAYGWTVQAYWPVKISKIFFQHCLFPVQHINTEHLMEQFYGYVSQIDKDTFQKCISDFSSVENEELLEALESHDCRTIVTKDNITPVLLEIAHKEIIQTPTYVSECWREVVNTISISKEKLNCVYSSQIPTNKSVTQLLSFPVATSQQERDAMKYLKRYVKELDAHKLGLFLRFCTGSDILNTDKISVELVGMTPFERRPIGHTCGAVLQIGNNFDNFMEFRSEFHSVLESQIWVMDIV